MQGIQSIKKTLLIQILIIFILCFSFIFPKHALADFTAVQEPTPLYTNSKSLTITIHTDKGTFTGIDNYLFAFWPPGTDSNNNNKYAGAPDRVTRIDNSTFKIGIPDIIAGWKKIGTWNYKIWSGQNIYDLTPATTVFSGSFYMYPPGQEGIGLPALQISSPVQENTVQSLTAVNINPNENYTIYFDGQKNTIQAGKFPQDSLSKNDKGQNIAAIQINVGGAQQNKRICLRQGTPFGIFGLNCDFHVDFDVTVLTPTNSVIKTGGEAGIPTGPPLAEESSVAITPACKPITENGKTTYICETAIGDINTNPQEFVKRIFSLVLGLAGGIALILIMVSGYKFMASRGDPEAVKAATEQLTSAVIGLLFIIFSFVILQIIGVDILRIPGFQP